MPAEGSGTIAKDHRQR